MSTERCWRNAAGGCRSAGQPGAGRCDGSDCGAKKTLRASEQSLPRCGPRIALTSKRSGRSSASGSGSPTPGSWSSSTKPVSPPPTHAAGSTHAVTLLQTDAETALIGKLLDQILAEIVHSASPRLHRWQHRIGIEAEFVQPHVVQAEIGRRRLDRGQRAVAEQLLQPRPLENPARAAERQRGARDPARRLADNIFRAVQRRDRLRRRPWVSLSQAA